ncbi:MAG TPA: hypothetical protein IAA94_00895 [Candidatus Galloscillospira stercoripullorum]|nr:hypothetical protein [Candidatus Galloscillospira stercoripullorum]
MGHDPPFVAFFLSEERRGLFLVTVVRRASNMWKTPKKPVTRGILTFTDHVEKKDGYPHEKRKTSIFHGFTFHSGKPRVEMWIILPPEECG